MERRGIFYVVVIYITKMDIQPVICFFFPMNYKINTHKYVYVNRPEKQLVHQIKRGMLGSARPSVLLDPMYL